jgi:hypothetical protein
VERIEGRFRALQVQQLEEAALDSGDYVFCIRLPRPE